MCAASETAVCIFDCGFLDVKRFFEAVALDCVFGLGLDTKTTVSVSVGRR